MNTGKAMIFAAGLGTRLKPLTDNMPKALVPIGGKPLLYHAISKLRKAGFDDITVNVFHFAEQIIDYLSQNDNFGANIQISDERPLLRDTGGGILHARNMLKDCDSFLVHNVDIISNLDIPALISSASDNALATIAVSQRETKRYLLFDDNMRMVGWTNIETGQVRSPYPDINPDNCRKLAFSGIHLINSNIFEAFDRFGFEEKFSIMDFYIKACHDYPIYGYVQEGYKMADVGKIGTLHDAERLLEEL